MHTNRRTAFTIVELLVSTAILALLMVLLLSTVDQTQRIWSRTTSKISQFQTSRVAFEALTRTLSQATLNTYYDIEFKDMGPAIGTIPISYHRQSDLHFVSGAASQPKFLDGDESTYPTHGVFFQAPLGHTDEPSITDPSVRKYRMLNNLMTAVGYYIKWGEDDSVPQFLLKDRQLFPPRYRYRLMQVMQPAEKLAIYTPLRKEAPTSNYSLPNDWIKVALGKLPTPGASKANIDSSWILSENVVALVLLPKLAERDRPSPTTLDLAPEYEYDSRPQESDGTIKKPSEQSPLERRQANQLPPIVQVVMVAIDEPSASRQQDVSTDPPNWTEGLFKTVRSEGDVQRDIGDPADPSPNTLIYRLQNPLGGRPVNFRIYTADVVIRGAKWSKDT